MEKSFDKLIKYTQGKLSDFDKKELEEQIKKDDDLEEEASFLQDLAKASEWKGLMDEAEEEMKESATSLATPTKRQEAKVKSLRVRRLLSYAASVTLFVLALGTWNANRNFSNLALADRNTAKMELLGEGLNKFRNTDASIEDPFQKGLDALQSQNFQEAITFFEAIPSTSETYAQARLFLALAQFEEKEWTKSFSNAEIVFAQSQNAATRQQAEWLLIQISLANDHENDARQILNRIANDDTHMYQQDAINLKKGLGSIWRRLVF